MEIFVRRIVETRVVVIAERFFVEVGVSVKGESVVFTSDCIGTASPVSIFSTSFNADDISDAKLTALVGELFDFRPYFISKKLDLPRSAKNFPLRTFGTRTSRIYLGKIGRRR
ncbi:MAG: methionine adenosyltransferase domain-containing protein [Holosporaceae bacterium]|nr:methionine adenosyltransferase domain-containing protein [Holosporaceae bacterium]